MTPRAVRRAERAAHLVRAALLILAVYDLLPSWGDPLVRWVVVPASAASGFAMWFAAPSRRLVKRVRAAVTPRSRRDRGDPVLPDQDAVDHQLCGGRS